jgi:hypothetical protein
MLLILYILIFSILSMETRPNPDLDPELVQTALDRLVEAVQSAVQSNIKNGLFHLPAADHDPLWVACGVLQKSGAFPQFKFTFYHQGMGEGTNTCAVSFVSAAITEEAIASPGKP